MGIRIDVVQALTANERDLIKQKSFKNLENAFRLKQDDKRLYRSISQINKEKLLPYDVNDDFIKLKGFP